MSGPPSATSDSTSSSLLARLRSSKAAAWQQLSDVYGPIVYSWCRQCRIPAQDTPDIIQEVFRAVHRSIATFRRDTPSDSFRAWVWTIVQSKVRDRFRSQAKNPDAVGGTGMQQRLSEIPDSPPESISRDPGPTSENSLLFRSLNTVRGEFEDRTWRAFWETVAEGRATADVATDLDMSPNAVRIARSRILTRLRDEFGDLLT